MVEEKNKNKTHEIKHTLAQKKAKSYFISYVYEKIETKAAFSLLQNLNLRRARGVISC